MSSNGVRSIAFQELRDYVDEYYQGKTEDFRDMLFAIAYTHYSHEKKTRLGRLEATLSVNGEELTLKDVGNVVVELCHDEEYAKICLLAEERLFQFGGELSEAVLTNISGVIVDQLKPKKGVWKFLKSSLIHAFEIVIAAFMLAIIYEVFVLIVPYVETTLDETVTKYLGKIRDLVIK